MEQFGFILIGALIVVGAYFIHKRATDNPKSGGGDGGKGGTDPGFKK